MPLRLPRESVPSAEPPSLCPQLADVESSPSKEDDEDDDDTMQNTVVLFSNTDKFVLMQVTWAWQDGQGTEWDRFCPSLSSLSTSPPSQDMCVVCGSFGRGAEGHLLACSQCSQCYHPYCVNSKVRRAPSTVLCPPGTRTKSHLAHPCLGVVLWPNPRRVPNSHANPWGHPRPCPGAHTATPPCPQITKVMLLKGWRCVECIVCEVCGKASDPSRLLLCDDCDISYHTYCLDPPLQTVPKGGWKCKW